MKKKLIPLILNIDTSCDETSVSVTKGLTILSNIVWSQSKIHAKFGGVVPNEARRQHESKILWVAKKAVNSAKIAYQNLDAISVTVGPGLSLALGVGINFAKELSIKLDRPLIGVNHLEGHILSAFAESKFQISNIKYQNEETKFRNPKLQIPNYKLHLSFPALGIVVSGGNTLLVLIENIGKYKVLGNTIDDALGESLDKSARLLGFGYPGGAILEKFAKKGDPIIYSLPLPMLGRENEGSYSYSGIKTAFSRLYNKVVSEKNVSKEDLYNLAATYQKTAFDHFFRVTEKVISSTLLKYNMQNSKHLFVGGGVAANVEFRKRIRTMCKKINITPLFPYSKRLYGDNAAMIGVAAYYKYLRNEFVNMNELDRMPNLKIDEKKIKQ